MDQSKRNRTDVMTREEFELNLILLDFSEHNENKWCKGNITIIPKFLRSTIVYTSRDVVGLVGRNGRKSQWIQNYADDTQTRETHFETFELALDFIRVQEGVV